MTNERTKNNERSTTNEALSKTNDESSTNFAMSTQLGDILIGKGLITQEQLDSAIVRHRETRMPLGKVLFDAGNVNEKQLLMVLAEQQHIPFVELKQLEIPPEVIGKVPAKFVWHYKIIPISATDNLISVAISNPFDVWPLDDLSTNLGTRVEKVLATAVDIEAAIKRYYGVAADAIERIVAEDRRAETIATFRPAGEIEDLEKLAEDVSVVNVVNQVLHQAIGDRATDIHLEYYREDACLRYRVDGVLRDARVSGDVKYLYPAIISRVKIMSGLDIIERRLPQDGRAKARIGDREFDLRVSVMPTIYGENVVIRILPTQMLFSMADLGMAEDDNQTLERLLHNTSGIIFVTGPTGSGKSTTLYASLKRLNSPERKLVTIEDPVEYELKGVSQVQVNPKIGLTFATALRSMLRHDPDVIMVGEIRDLETANIAIRAALTGHLVLSTLHTNDAAGGVTRLMDIGIEPYLIASSVRAFMAQRLVRVVCPHCREECAVGDQEMLRFKNGAKPQSIWRGSGCENCGGSGYRGRTGIYEIITVNDEMREMIARKAPLDEIKRQARTAGLRSLEEDGLRKIAAGVTTPEEVLRVTQVEN